MEPRVEELSHKIQKLLIKFPSLQIISETNKVKCSLSGHEMPCREDVISSYVKGKKFLKLQARDDRNFEKYKPHIVPSTKKHHENQLFCNLTMSHVNKTHAHIERHVNGGKYRRALARWEDCQRKGIVYKPPRGRRKMQDQDLKKGDHSKGDVVPGDADVNDGEVSETDSLSDLYPGKDLNEDADEEGNGANKAWDEDSDFEFEDMEATDNTGPEATDNTRPGTSTESEAGASVGQKRKQEKFMGKKKHKQMKKKKQKVV